MEDERGAGGHDERGADRGGSDPPLSSKLAFESVVGSMSSDNQVEEAFAESDGEEIMVEVVGSDVYVDGISGNGEGDCEMGGAADLEVRVVEKNEESSDVSRKGGMDKTEEGGLGSSEPREDRVVGRSEESSDVSREGGENKMEEGELRDEKSGVTEKLDIDSSKSIGIKGQEVSPLPVGGVGGTDGASSEASVPPTEAAGVSPVEICDEEKTKDGTVDKASSEVVLPETSSHPVEAVSKEKSDLVKEREVLSSSDNATSHDLVSADSVKSEEKHDGNHDVIGEVHRVDASGGELLDSDTKKDSSFKADIECPSTDGDLGTQDKSIGEKDVRPAESENSRPKPDAIVSEVLDESQNCSDEIHGEKLEPASNAGLESNHDNSFKSRKGETEGNNKSPKNEVCDLGDASEVNKDKYLKVELTEDTEENEQTKTSLSSPTEKEIVDSETVELESCDQNVVKVVEKGVSGEKCEEINSDTVVGHENTEISAQDHLPEEGAQAVAVKITETSNHEVEDTDMVPKEVTDVAADSEITPEEFGSPQSKKEPADLQITETTNHKGEIAAMVPNEVTNVAAADSDITEVSVILEGTGNAEPLFSTDFSLLDGSEIKENHDEAVRKESNGFHVLDALEGYMPEAKPMDVEEERESDQTYHDVGEIDTELAAEGPSSESDKAKTAKEDLVNYAGFLKMKQSGYLPPPDNEGCFAPSDLVWGKVRSHPWWPGQIFDPADASEKAVKYHKKDSYLVAYFGDQTFAWNDSSALKPFRSYFSQIQKQSNSESFHNAVSCTLEEIDRRVQLGLSCSCIRKDDYAKIETQVVENTGISEESSRRHGVDQSSCASHFEPNELLEFIRGVAPLASSGADGLDLVIALAQLSAFCSFKGYRAPTKFPGELLEVDGDFEQVNDEAIASQKYRPKDGAQSRKERSMMELMGDREYSPDLEDEPFAGDYGNSGKKRKVLDPLAEGSDKRVSFSAAKVSTPTSQAPKPSFKIGECIRRVASQLTGTPLLKGGDDMIIDGSPNTYETSEKQGMTVSAESLSVDEILSQLEHVAQDPKKRLNVPKEIRSFFIGFRSSTTISRRGRKKRSEQAVGGSGEEFEFDDVNDSYWTDRIVQNYTAEQLLHERMNGAGNLQLMPFGTEKPAKAGRKPHSRKRFSTGNFPNSTPEFDESAKRIKQDSSPAELILNFADRNFVPSEINLNKMFRRFGAIMESETEVNREVGSAKVIFKRGSDAEVARNSAEKFSIFGPALVNFQIGYSPVISVKISPITLFHLQEEATMML